MRAIIKGRYGRVIIEPVKGQGWHELMRKARRVARARGLDREVLIEGHANGKH